MLLGQLESYYFDVNMCMTMLKSLFVSQPYYLFYYMVTNLGVWLNSFPKKFAVFVIDVFEPCVMSTEFKLIYFEWLPQNFIRESLCHLLMSVSRQQLCWAGHVMCMPWDCLPKMMISSWYTQRNLKAAQT